MSFQTALKACAPSVLKGHICGCLLGGLGVMIVSHLIEDASVGMLLIGISDGVMAAVFAFVIGALPIWLYAFPTYAWLTSIKHASFLSAAAIGLLPIALMLPFFIGSGLFAAFSLPVALLTHYFHRQSGARSNNSFKPKPLRGSA